MDRQRKGSNKGPQASKGKGGGEGKGGKGGRGKGRKTNINTYEQGGASQEHTSHALTPAAAEGVPPSNDAAAAAVPARKRGRGNTSGAAERKAEQEAKLKAAMEQLVRDENSGATSGAGFDFTSVSEVQSTHGLFRLSA
jgi:hypothetical protein